MYFGRGQLNGITPVHSKGCTPQNVRAVLLGDIALPPGSFAEPHQVPLQFGATPSALRFTTVRNEWVGLDSAPAVLVKACFEASESRRASV